MSRALCQAMPLAALGALLACCGSASSEPDATGVGPESVSVLTRDEILERRARLDRMFRGESSPLTAPHKAAFAGLDYYPPNPDLQFRLPLRRYAEPESLRFPYTGGDGEHDVLRWGYFEFEVDGVRVRLQAYRTVQAGAPGDGLFVPFRDATSGKETYGGGRYLEMPYEPAAWYALDFNLAFAPYCAHNPEWSCPRTPTENTLPVAIRAGERGPLRLAPAETASASPEQQEES